MVQPFQGSAVINPAGGANPPCQEEHLLGGGGFAGIDMRQEPDISEGKSEA